MDVLADRYRIDGPLGRGAFATTYAGVRLTDGMPVAIKALELASVDDWKVVELFEREAKVLASLDHPQIPDYVEFLPLAADRRAYLVQARAPGRSLAALLADGRRFTPAQLRDLAEQLLGILVYLAELAPPVVHRDIKPSNVILDDAGRCFLVDFGSVRDLVGRDTGGSTVAGTFGYMAPEQLRGEARPSADLYGLGMTLVHLLTGREPTELPQRRLLVDFRAVVTIDEGLAGFLDGLIQPAPEDRFASPRDALAALRRGVAPERALSVTRSRAGRLPARKPPAGGLIVFPPPIRDAQARLTLQARSEGLVLTIRP